MSHYYDWGVAELKVPVEFLLFPKRTTIVDPWHDIEGNRIPSQSVVRGVTNVVRILPNLGQFGVSAEGTARCGAEKRVVEFGAAWLEIMAMSPILMLHGAGDNASFFFRSRPISGGTPGFDVPYKAQLIPFDYLYSTRSEDEDAAIPNGSVLDVAPLLKGRLMSYAKEWGVSKLHLIGHSKGGLFARYFAKTLTYSAGPFSTQSFGFLTVTTLDSPHHGTVLADLLAPPAFLFSLLPKFSTLFGMVQGVTTTAIINFSLLVPPPTTPLRFRDADLTQYTTAYGTTAAEADINGNEHIDSDEARGFDGHPTWLVDAAYQTVRRPWCSWDLEPPIGCSFQPWNSNDAVVTVASSRLEGAEDIPQLSKNHMSVGDNDIGLYVLNRIKGFDPVPTSW